MEEKCRKSVDKFKMDKRKVLLVTTDSGFLSQFELNNVRILQEIGYEVHYASNFKHSVYYYDRCYLEEMGIILHSINVVKPPIKLCRNIQAILQLKEIIDSEGIQMLHCHNPMGGAVGRCAARISKQRPYVIYTVHGFHFYQGGPLGSWVLINPIERLLARWTDIIITINKEDYLQAAGFNLKTNGFVEWIHGVGVDTKRFQRKPELKERKRKELGIPDDGFHIVTAAELNRNKNQRVVIEALAGMQQQNIFYSICGTGPEEETLLRLIKSRNLENRVRLLGFRNDMEEILQTADLAVFPSIREGLGMAGVEALACGIPLVAADNRGTREYVITGVNGILCPAKSIKAFREAIQKFYEDETYRCRLAEQCRKTIRPFCMENIDAKMRSIYQKAEEAMQLAHSLSK